MAFRPPHCPNSACPSNPSGPFRWRHKGTYRRLCDGRTVPRFLCLECRRHFSSQTFRLDYRLHRPGLNTALFKDFVSKTTHRQSARTLGCNRKTVAHRVALLGDHCRSFHRRMLDDAARRGGLEGLFQLDELETFEQSRRLAPVTVPVLVEARTRFVVGVRAAPLPARGRLRPADRAKKRQRAEKHGVRRCGSRAAVEACLHDLGRARPRGPLVIESDSKSTYPICIRKVLGARALHAQLASNRKASPNDPLFPVNHVLALLRDGVSRLVRRSWAAAKCRQWLERHLWVWVAYRNYVRPFTNTMDRTTSAAELGLTVGPWRPAELLARRIFEWRCA